MAEALEDFTEREEIEMLLPWYVTGRIEPSDRARVERYLEAHPEMRAQLELIADEQGETIVANEALAGAPAGALENLRAAIAAEPKRFTSAGVGRSLWAELSRLFSAPTPRAVQWAAAAAVVLIVAQAATIGGMLSQPSAPVHRTASGETVKGTTVLVQFAPGVAAEKLSAFLRRERLQIVAGPKPGGIYELQVSSRQLEPAERAAAVEKIKAASGYVARVLP